MLYRNLSFAILFLMFSMDVQAQFCTGTLGDNIFAEGDFGIGNPNLLSPNPGIAPGYTYTFNVPPLDGQYVITNNTAIWPLWETWLPIGDNSANPNGYMMIVNATNVPGLFYEQTVSGLCENTLFEFSADIINLIRIGTPNHIDPNVSFLLDGVEFFNTGVIPKTEDWTTFGFTFTTEIGQESLTLSLRNNAPGGNGNDLALDNISFRACGPEIILAPQTSEINLCEAADPFELTASILGNQYANPAVQWQQSFNEGFTWGDISGETGITFSAPTILPGTYYYRFVVADGVGNLGSDNCRVNSESIIINILQSETIITESICNGAELVVGDNVYSTTGIFMDTLTNFLGCDSIVITDLTVEANPNFMAELVVDSPCGNQEQGSISVENISGGTAPFNFIFEGIDFGTTSFFSGLNGGASYSIVVEDEDGCSIELSAFIDNPVELVLELGPNQVIELGETVDISPFYNFTPTNFNWQTSSPINCLDFEDCNELIFLPTTSQQVRLDLFSGTDCFISDSIFIEVIEVRNVWLPNAFSPNGDGINDVFTVYGQVSNVQMVESFTIFDRWGSVMFEQSNFPPNDLQSGWDGTSRGKPSSSGIYIYTASVRFADEQVLQYSGDVSLIR